MIELPKQVLEITNKLSTYGYDAYIYGECVRLALKGQTLFDFDVVTNAEMSRVCSIFESEPESFIISEDNLDKGELLIRVLGVAITVISSSDMESELKKQDFTINAIAYSPEKGFFDPFGGLKHLENSVITFINPDGINPLSVLPALGWLSQEEYELCDSVKKTLRQNYSVLTALPPEIMREDFEQILMGKRAGSVLTEESAAVIAAIPEFNMIFEKMPDFSFKCVGSSSPILTLRYALLLHELGKPDCHSVDSDGNAHYYGYIERSRIYAQRIMKRLACDKFDIKETCYIIENHVKVTETEFNEIKDLLEEHPADLLKLLFLFNCAVSRADGNEKDAARSKKLASLII